MRLRGETTCGRVYQSGEAFGYICNGKASVVGFLLLRHDERLIQLRTFVHEWPILRNHFLYGIRNSLDRLVHRGRETFKML